MKKLNAPIADYINGHLSSRRVRRFEAQMAGDESLRREVTRLAQEMRRLRELARDPAREPCRHALDARLAKAFAQQRGKTVRRFRPGSLWFVPALAGVLALLGTLFFPQWLERGFDGGEESLPLAESAPPSGSQTIHVVLETEDPQIKIYWAFEKGS